MSSFINSLYYFSQEDYVDALEEHGSKISIGGRTITNSRLPMTLMLVLKKSRN